MKQIEIHTIPIAMRQFSEQFPFANWLERELRSNNSMPADEIDSWMKELSEKSTRGEF